MIIDCHVHVCAATPRPRADVRAAARRASRSGSCAGGLGSSATTAADRAGSWSRSSSETIDGHDGARRRRRPGVRRRSRRRRAARRAPTRTCTSPTITSSSWRSGIRKMLFGASVHPYRKDAVAELERCVAAGAVLLKWLPITQGFNPADPRCFPFYEALAHHKLPLL